MGRTVLKLNQCPHTGVIEKPALYAKHDSSGTSQKVAQQECQRAEQLAAYLGSIGVDPDNLP